MDCSKVQKNLIAYLDGELSAAEHRAITRHLATCSTCAQERARLELTQAHVQEAVAEVTENVELPAARGKRIRARMAAEVRGTFRSAAHLWEWLSALFTPRRLAYATIALVAAFALVTAYITWAVPRQVIDQETLVVGQTEYAPGATGGVRVVVRDVGNGNPIPDAEIVVKIGKAPGLARPIFEGKTDEYGSANVVFVVPDDLEGKQNLYVETKSRLGYDELSNPITVRRDFKLLLTTDKPVYQPGQTIHIRALALMSANRRPIAGADLRLVVKDAQGNKVFQRTERTSEYGIASADFVLASEVNAGDYQISAELGDTTSEKTVEVKHYVLPKFKVEVVTEKEFYQPGAVVEGTVRANYFFGKPVAGGKVELLGYQRDVDEHEAINVQGTTDADGNFMFTFTVPEYFIAGQPEDDVASLRLTVGVIDAANHREEKSKYIPIAKDVIIIDAVPESGVLRPGIENIIYIVTTYPDGAPAQTMLSVNGMGLDFTHALETGAHGLAELRVTPPTYDNRLGIVARDAQGNRAEKQYDFALDSGAERVIVRPERAAYRVGETMNVEVLTTRRRGTVYLDVTKEGQTLAMYALPLEKGRATTGIDLDNAMFGTLEVHAYVIMAEGNTVRDTRLVLVDNPNEIAVTMNADKETYKPGETAHLEFQTTKDGAGVPSALGIAVVDEAVFALSQQDPGFAKLYFLLQKELMEPKFELHNRDYRAPIKSPSDDYATRAAQDDAAKAALASAPKLPFGLTLNSRILKLAELIQKQARYFQANRTGVAVGMMAIASVLLIATVVALRHHHDRGRVFTRVGASIGLLILLSPVLLPLLGISLFLVANVPGLFGILLLIAAAVSFSVLAIQAWTRRDDYLQFGLILFSAYLVLLVLLFYSDKHARQGVGGWLPAGIALTFLFVPLTFWMRSVGSWLDQRKGEAVAAAVLAYLTFPAVVLIYVSPIAAASPQEAARLISRATTSPLVGCAAPTPRVREVAGETVVVEKEVAVEKTVEVEKEAEQEAVVKRGGADKADKAAEKPRLRQYFPETLYWEPQLLTDERGRAALDIPMADSITTWRLSALASSQRGELGGLVAGLRVFQDFFIDLDLPVALTAGDEIAIPVAVYNYLETAQDVRLELTEEDWFELLDEPVKEMTIAANEVSVVYFRFRVVRFGTHDMTVTAWGERMSDAIRKPLRVYPDGKRLQTTISDRLQGDTVQTIAFPTETQTGVIKGTAKIIVKIYPGVMSQIVEGLATLLKMPYG